MITAEFVIVALVFFGAGVAMVRAALLRRQAVQQWREALGGAFDTRQRKFATDLDLDRARLPPAAKRSLAESRRSLLAGSAAALVAAAMLYWVAAAHA